MRTRFDAAGHASPLVKMGNINTSVIHRQACGQSSLLDSRCTGSRVSQTIGRGILFRLGRASLARAFPTAAVQVTDTSKGADVRHSGRVTGHRDSETHL